jgi:hypothetical protein
MCKFAQNKNAHEHTGSAENIRPSLRNGFTTYSVLSLVTGLSCHHRCAGNVPRNLTPASGRQDHTTSPSACALFVNSAFASIAIPRPTFVTIASAPLVGAERTHHAADLALR